MIFLYLSTMRTDDHHPCQFLQLLLDIYRYRWQRNDMLNLLKTELTLPISEEGLPKR